RLAASAGVLMGDPLLVADSVSSEPTLGTAALSVSHTGVVAYRSGINARRQLTWFDRTGKMLGTLGEPDGSGPSSPVLAPDDKRAAIFRNTQGNTDVYIVDAVR